MNEPPGILILAGGEATRLPGKLLLAVGDSAADEMPMLVRVLRNMRDAQPREIVISGKSSFPPDVDALLDAPLVIDRWPGRGPLAGILTAFAQMRSRYVFVVAGDAPNLTAAFANELATRIRVGDEAIVPEHPERGGIEPLAAIYDRLAFLREGLPVLRSGGGALRRVVERLRVRHVPVDDRRIFANINTPADYAATRGRPLRP